jgi:hypothetical protein
MQQQQRTTWLRENTRKPRKKEKNNPFCPPLLWGLVRLLVMAFDRASNRSRDGYLKTTSATAASIVRTMWRKVVVIRWSMPIPRPLRPPPPRVRLVGRREKLNLRRLLAAAAVFYGLCCCCGCGRTQFHRFGTGSTCTTIKSGLYQMASCCSYVLGGWLRGHSNGRSKEKGESG